MALRRISFEELIEGSQDVQVTEDNLLHATDLTMAVTGKNRDDAGKALRNLNPEVFDSVNFTYRHLASNAGKNTTLVSFDHAMELVMVLPGKMAKQFPVDACEILKRSRVVLPQGPDSEGPGPDSEARVTRMSVFWSRTSGQIVSRYYAVSTWIVSQLTIWPD